MQTETNETLWNILPTRTLKHVDQDFRQDALEYHVRKVYMTRPHKQRQDARTLSCTKNTEQRPSCQPRLRGQRPSSIMVVDMCHETAQCKYSNDHPDQPLERARPSKDQGDMVFITSLHNANLAKFISATCSQRRSKIEIKNNGWHRHKKKNIWRTAFISITIG